MAIKLKRVYDKPERADGVRILVDRLWPRGLSKDEAGLDEWIRDIAPSNRLRAWFGHKPGRWREFQKRYRQELSTSEKKAMLARLRKIARISTVTLLYAAKDTERNNAVALAGFLKEATRPHD
jgi:uncharacterized protein YeaO (DUF488 family)